VSRIIIPRKAPKEKASYNLLRLLDLFASKASSFLSSTLFKNSTFSKYPPPLRLATSSSVIAASCWVLTWAFQSIADLSKVVSFFAFCEDGRAAKDVLGLRGPGRLPGAGCGFEADGESKASELEAAAFRSTQSAEEVEDGPVFSCSGGRHSGHFLASGESSATSVISLAKLDSQLQ
jgi:hypothetical protein